jgi:deoxycytidylate deaminase
VYKGRRLIASGFNDSSKTHPRGCGHNNSHHAEFSAILRAKRVRSNLRGCSIFVVRINRRGEIRFSKPCSDCWAHIENEGLKPFWSEHDDGLCRQNWA